MLRWKRGSSQLLRRRTHRIQRTFLADRFAIPASRGQMQSQAIADADIMVTAAPAAEPHTPKARIELTVVVPTFNERDNVELLLERLDAALGEIAWEVVFVDDDSPDG